MPPFDPNAPKPGDPIIFDRFDGLKNTVLQERLGPRDLLRAQNIYLDDVGQAHRRRGVTLQLAGNAHSAFTSSTGVTLLVLNQTLGVLGANYAFTSVLPGIATDPQLGSGLGLAYAQVGDNVYYSGPAESGIFNLPSLTVSAWGSEPDMWLSPVVNPTSTLPAIAGKLIGKPPFASFLAPWHGRIYLGVGSVLWATELYLYNFVDRNAGFKQFEASITMVAAVSDGVYVGTTEGLYFLSGPTFAELGLLRVMDSGVIPGSMVYIPGELGNPPQVPTGADTQVEVAIMFMSTTGACVAADGGKVINMTESKIVFPGAQSGASMYRRMDGVNQFVSALQSGGTASQNSAIGDYISATLIRGAARGAWVPLTDTVTMGDSISFVYQPANTLTEGAALSDSFMANFLAGRVTEDGQIRYTENGQQRVTS